jgi:hypothetical protein
VNIILIFESYTVQPLLLQRRVLPEPMHCSGASQYCPACYFLPLPARLSSHVPTAPVVKFISVPLQTMHPHVYTANPYVCIIIATLCLPVLSIYVFSVLHSSSPLASSKSTSHVSRYPHRANRSSYVLGFFELLASTFAVYCSASHCVRQKIAKGK